GAVVGGLRGPGSVPQRVLIAGGVGNPGIGLLNALPVELGHHVPAGIAGISGQDISRSEAGDANAIQLVIDRDGGCINAHGKYADIVGEEDFLYFLVSGGAAQFASVTDDEDDAPARLVALAQVLSGAQNGVIQHVKLPWRRLHFGGPAAGGIRIVDRMAVNAWPSAKRPAGHGRAALAPRPLDPVEDGCGDIRSAGIAGNLRNRVTIAVQSHFVKLAE